MRKLVLLVAVIAACGSSSSSPSQVATPTFNPGSGTYISAPTVTIATSTAGATIYYTTDGSTPTTSSTVYTAPVPITTATATTPEGLQAIATKSGLKNSSVGTASYIVNPSAPVAATPTFSPAAGSYPSAQSVTISTTTSGATIYYTTDGSNPTTSSKVYSSPVSVSASETLSAIAVASGFANSAVGTASYTIGSGSGGSFASLCQSVFSTYSNLYETCLKANPAALSSIAGFISNFCSVDQTEINAGRVVFNSAQASACQSAFAGLSCAELAGATLQAACSGVLTGTVANGSACYTGIDCANGSCDDSATTCPGTCSAYATQGQSCATQSCAPGLTCILATTTCQTPVVAGGACTSTSDCAGGLFCDTASSNTCKAQQTSGACSTSNADQCAIGSVCASGTSTCMPLQGAGGSCSASPEDLCGVGYECNTAGTCVSWPSVGQACSASAPQCIDSFCDITAASPVCTAYVAVGSPCTSPLQCQSFNCSGNPAVCQASTATGCTPP